MNVFTHLILSSHLKPIFEEKLNIKINFLNGISFFYGNIRPDVRLETTMKNHTKNKYTDYTHNLIRNMYLEIEEGIGYRKFLMDLGSILHFTCDFFCFPHNSHYEGNIPQHHLYEYHQMMYMGKNVKEIISKSDYPFNEIYKNYDELVDFIEKYHKKYVSDNSLKDYEKDMVYSIRACLVVGNSILAAYLKKVKMNQLNMNI